jgi:hypothetical protein
MFDIFNIQFNKDFNRNLNSRHQNIFSHSIDLFIFNNIILVNYAIIIMMYMMALSEGE